MTFPTGGELLTCLASLYPSSVLLGHPHVSAVRPLLVAAVGEGAKALGPEAFVRVLPIKVLRPPSPLLRPFP